MPLVDIDRRSVRFFENRRLSFKPNSRLVLARLMTLLEVSDRLSFEFSNQFRRQQEIEGIVIGFKTSIEGLYRIGIQNQGKVTWIGLDEISLASIQPTETVRVTDIHTSEFAQKLGVTSLVKVADVENMVATFQSGALLPGEHQPWHDGVYMEARGQKHAGRPHTPYNTPEMNRNVIIYVMDTLPLNRADSHATWGWHYGYQITHSGEPVIQASDRKGIHSFLLNLPAVNEVVFTKPILMKHLKILLVQPGQKPRILKILKDAGLEPPIARSWDEIISEQETWP